ncbi:MAG: DUF5615 family PIN-like protein [Limisphaerales bacterium]
MGRLQICADENFPGQAVHALRENGHDVLWMAEQGPRTADVDVLALADAEGRLLVTFDKDFGEMAVRRRLRATSGIVLFRIKVIDPEETARRLVRILETSGLSSSTRLIGQSASRGSTLRRYARGLSAKHTTVPAAIPSDAVAVTDTHVFTDSMNAIAAVEPPFGS